MNIKELFKRLNKEYPIVEKQHYITYNDEYDCLVIWIYRVINGKIECHGYSFLEDELNDIDKIIKEIEETLDLHNNHI